MKSRSLKVMFVNFQGGMKVTKGYLQYGLYGWKYFMPHNSAGLNELIDLIRQELPDIVCCVEMENGSQRSKGVDHAQEISKKTHLKNYRYFQALKIGNLIDQGNVILSRFPLDNFLQKKLPGYGESRYLCGADVCYENEKLTCYVTHLSTNKMINIVQREYIARFVGDESNPVILTGDFNTQKDQLQIIRSHTQLDDLDMPPTFPSWRPVKKLDHIFISTHFTCEKVLSYQSVLISDHVPIAIDVNFTDM